MGHSKNLFIIGNNYEKLPKTTNSQINHTLIPPLELITSFLIKHYEGQLSETKKCKKPPNTSQNHLTIPDILILKTGLDNQILQFANAIEEQIRQSLEKHQINISQAFYIIGEDKTPYLLSTLLTKMTKLNYCPSNIICITRANLAENIADRYKKTLKTLNLYSHPNTTHPLIYHYLFDTNFN